MGIGRLSQSAMTAREPVRQVRWEWPVSYSRLSIRRTGMPDGDQDIGRCAASKRLPPSHRRPRECCRAAQQAVRSDVM
jgi:hypothetical protein